MSISSEKIKSDLQFNKWRYGFIKEDESGISHRFAAQKSFLGRFSNAIEGSRALENDTNKTSIYLEKLHKYMDLHIPSTQRNQVMKNLTFNALDVIPVFCDIKGKPLTIPKELTFEHTDYNIINRELDMLLVKALELTEKDERSMVILNSPKLQKCVIRTKETIKSWMVDVVLGDKISEKGREKVFISFVDGSTQGYSSTLSVIENMCVV